MIWRKARPAAAHRRLAVGGGVAAKVSPPWVPLGAAPLGPTSATRSPSRRISPVPISISDGASGSGTPTASPRG